MNRASPLAQPLAPLVVLVALSGCAPLHPAYRVRGGVARNDLPLPDDTAHVVLRAETRIDAPPELVFALLSDLSTYSAWNPWLIEAWGEDGDPPLAPGQRAWARVRLNGRTRIARHLVLQVDAPLTLCWRDDGWTTAHVYGQRCRFLTRTEDGGTHLRQALQLAGPMVGFAERRFGATLQEGLEAETEAVARAAEEAARAAEEDRTRL